MKDRLTIDGVVYWTPFRDLLPAYTPERRAQVEADILENGVQVRVVVAHIPRLGKIIVDGMNRAEIAERHGIYCPLDSLGHITEEVARERAVKLNVNRRHMTPEQEQEARRGRIPRVTARRSSGDSLGVIAEAEGVSIAQVRRDLQDAEAIVPGGTMPETPLQIVTAAGHTYRPPKKPKREKVAARAYSAADALVGAVRALMKSQQRARFAALAEAAGVPIGERDWPALETLRAVLRDLASGAVLA